MEKEKKEEKEVIEEKDEKRNNKKKTLSPLVVNTICVSGILIGLFTLGIMAGMAKGYISFAETHKPKTDVVDNCISYYEEPKEESNKEENQTEPVKPNSTWKSLGTNLSQVESIHNDLKSYTYSSSRARGGYSFFDKELFGIVGSHITEADITDIEKDDNNYVYYGRISREKADSILNHYFGNNYNYESNLTKNQGENYRHNYQDYLGQSLLFSILNYDAEGKFFNVYYHGADGTSGPSPTIVNRKVVEVFEKDDAIKVVEKVIYLDQMSTPDSIYYSIYANPSKTMYITSKYLKIEGIQNETISVDDYDKYAGIITSIYVKGDDGAYHFASSEISDKVL